MMITPENLLAMKPLYALKSMISERWPSSSPEWFTIKEIIGNSASADYVARVGLSNLHVPLSLREVYRDDFEYTFTKLDISLLNNKGPIPVKISSIKTKPTLVDALEYHYSTRGDLKFCSTDFINFDEELVPGTFTALTAPTSYRWRGILNLVVTLIKENIDKYVVRRTCVMDHTNYFTEDTVKSELVSSLNRQNVGLLQVLLSDDWCELVSGTMNVIDNESEQINTEIKIRFNAVTSPYEGSVIVKYGRRSFYTTFAYPVNIPVSVTGNSNTLSLINNKLKSNISLNEIEWPVNRPAGKHPLHINVGSLAHVGTLWVEYE